MGYMDNDWHDGWGGGHFLFHFASFAFWALLIAIVVLVTFRLLNKSEIGRDKDSPLEILDRRLARGEVSKDEYLVARELLEENRKKR